MSFFTKQLPNFLVTRNFTYLTCAENTKVLNSCFIKQATYLKTISSI